MAADAASMADFAVRSCLTSASSAASFASRSRRVAERYGAELRVAPGRGHMLIIEPGFEELCDWIDAWLQGKSLDSQRRISA